MSEPCTLHKTSCYEALVINVNTIVIIIQFQQVSQR